MDIIGVLPMFLSITGRYDPDRRARVIDKSMIVALAVALAFIAGGQFVFRLMGISLYDFKIAGGLVLLLISLADLIGGPEAVNHASGQTGVVPLAVPLITGPAVLTTVVLQVGTFGYAVTISALFANYILAWVLLRKSTLITRLIGTDGTVVFSKIAALIMVAFAIAMIRAGAFDAVQAFLSPNQNPGK